MKWLQNLHPWFDCWHTTTNSFARRIERNFYTLKKKRIFLVWHFQAWKINFAVRMKAKIYMNLFRSDISIFSRPKIVMKKREEEEEEKYFLLSCRFNLNLMSVLCSYFDCSFEWNFFLPGSLLMWICGNVKEGIYWLIWRYLNEF